MSTPKVAELLREATARLPGEEARFEAEQLLLHALGVERAWLFAHATDAVDEAGCQALAERLVAIVEQGLLAEAAA